ncbi:MAG TPA: ScyD/ScyE family protein, partial [Candidatus Dormibacteraeota bacterium]|nr:ScyD/ScyE family protein [Candidatus Dormibacteraeota bacterium]
MSLKRRHLFALPALAVVVAMLPSQAAAAPTVSVVTSGLDSPRGVAFFHGKLVVGEAGHGGSLCVPAGPTGEA